MRDITLNPTAATEDDLESALDSPKDSEDKLRAYSQDFEVKSMVYKRLISYLSNMLSFDVTYTSTAGPEDYGKPRYKRDLETVERLLDKFDYKKEFSVAVREMLRNDAYFACIRELENNIVLQELPADYCKITGRWEAGFLFSFDMNWFISTGVDINMYPDFFKKKYKEIWEEGNLKQRYLPSLPLESRSKSSWAQWVDVPVDVGVCFKMTPELATRLPYFTPLFSDLVLQPTIRILQKNANMAAASKMIVGQVPMLKDDIKATVKDSIAISPELLGKFMALVKSAISEAIKVASAPLEDMQSISFDLESEIYENYLRTMLATTGTNTNLLFTSDLKANVIETQLSLNVDEQMMCSLYLQFNSFMNYLINKKTTRFKFYIEFEGTHFFLNRQLRYDYAMELFDKGIVLPQKIAAAIGMKPSQMRKQMEESKAMGFVTEMLTSPTFEQQKEMADIQGKQQEKLSNINAENQIKTMQNTENQNGNSTSRGRPRKKDSELSEEGSQTRTEGTNIGRGGKVR
jgi:hypothetical protein